MELKILYTTMETIKKKNKTKRQHSEMEKIFANKATEQGLISKIQKQCMEHLTKTNKYPMQKWPKELNRHFSSEEIQKANKHMKNMLIIVKYYRNANQNYSEVSPHTIQKVKVKVAQLCLTLCDPMDCIFHGILQAKILEWVAFPFSRESSQPSNRTRVSCIAGRFFTN